MKGLLLFWRAVYIGLSIGFYGAQCFGGTPREKAVAAVNVAIAFVEQEQPQLQDTTNRFPKGAPNRLAEFPLLTPTEIEAEPDPQSTWVETSVPFADGITVNICTPDNCYGTRAKLLGADQLHRFLVVEAAPVDPKHVKQVTIQEGGDTCEVARWFQSVDGPSEYLFVVVNKPEPVSAIEAVPPKEDPDRRRLSDEIAIVRSENDGLRVDAMSTAKTIADLTETLAMARKELAEAREESLAKTYEIAELKLALSQPVPVGPSGLPPVQSPATEVIEYEPIELTVHTADGKPGETWCTPCNEYHKKNHAGDARIAIKYTTTLPPRIWEDGRYRAGLIPMATWLDADGKLTYREGFYSLDDLWDYINKPENKPPVRKVKSK